MGSAGRMVRLRNVVGSSGGGLVPFDAIAPISSHEASMTGSRVRNGIQRNAGSGTQTRNAIFRSRPQKLAFNRTAMGPHLPAGAAPIRGYVHSL
jgi:hypothetical protein